MNVSEIMASIVRMVDGDETFWELLPIILSEIGAIIETDRQEPPVRIHRQLTRQRERTALIVGHEYFRARRDPFHGAPQSAGSQHGRVVFGIGSAPHSEAAPDVLGHKIDLAFLEACHLRDLVAHSADALEREVNGIDAACGIERHQASARFQRVANQTLTVDGDGARVAGLRERGGDGLRISGFEFKRQIAGNVGMKLRRTLGYCGLEAQDRREIAVLDFDELARVLRNRGRVRNDHCDRLSDKAHALLRQRGEMCFADLLAVLSREGHPICERVETGFPNIIAG